MTSAGKCSSCGHDVHERRCGHYEYIGHGYQPCECGVVLMPEPEPSWVTKLLERVDHLTQAVLDTHVDVRRLAVLCESHEERLAAVESGRRLTLTPLPGNGG